MSNMNADRIRAAVQTLLKYKAGKANLERRVKETEEWWKQRHRLRSDRGSDVPYTSAWLFNSVINRHADAIAMYPQPNILPREPGDKALCEQLSRIVPCVLERAEFEETYSRVMWQKMKQGTGIYGVFWDQRLSGGLGDIAVKKIDVMNLFWEPGITDLNDSANIFLVTPTDRVALAQAYPEAANRLNDTGIRLTEYLYDDRVDRSDKVAVIDWYYKVRENNRVRLHYCRFVGDTILYASEDDTRPASESRRLVLGSDIASGEPYAVNALVPSGPSVAEVGWYAHGEYPFVMDPLFPVEGSPCGFGYVDVGKSAQEQIDLMNRAIVRNALVAATPRYFIREDGGINEAEFADIERPLVHVNANLGEDTVRRIDADSLHANYITILNNKITELKETGNNIDSSNGITNGVTAASGIAAQQEAAGKTSRAATMSAYRAFSRVVRLIICLMAQFYDDRRVFRVLGETGGVDFIAFDNAALRPEDPLNDPARMPDFDIRVTAQSKSVYTQNAQNQLAVSLANLGVFDPNNTDQALLLLSCMDFDGKEDIERRISQAGTDRMMFARVSQIALALAQRYDPAAAEELAGILTARAGITSAGSSLHPGAAPARTSAAESHHTSSAVPEDARVTRARRRADLAPAVT